MIRVYFLLLFLVNFYAVTYAQTWSEEHQHAYNAYHSGNYLEAVEVAGQNLFNIQKVEGVESEAYAQELRLLTLVSYSLGLYKKASAYASQEVRLRERMNKVNDPDYPGALNNLIQVQLKLGQYPQAIQGLHNALSALNIALEDEEIIRYRLLLVKAYMQVDSTEKAKSLLKGVQSDVKQLKSDHFLLALSHFLDYQLTEGLNPLEKLQILNTIDHSLQQHKFTPVDLPEHASLIESLAQEYQGVANFKDAQNLYLKLNGLYEKGLLTDSLRWSGVLNNLGAISVKTDPEKASKWLSKAFSIQKTLSKKKGNVFWSSLDNYALSLHRQGETWRAVQLYEQYKSAFFVEGNHCKALWIALNNYAFLLKKSDRRKQALQVLWKADQMLDQNLEALSQKQLLYLTTLHYNLAQSYQSFSQYDSAIFFYKRSTETAKLAQATQSAEYLAAITGMAGLYHDIGQYTEAKIFYVEALKIQEILGGVFSNTYASIQSNFALLYQDLGAYKEAIGLIEEALSTKRKILGIDHPDYIAVLANLGLLYLEKADYTSAQRILETVLIKYENLYKKQHPRLASSLTNLARLELAVGNYNQAEPLLKQALQMQENLYGTQHPAYAVNAVELGNYYMLLGNYEAAEPLLAQSRHLLQEIYGNKHPAYATATQNLAVLSQAKGNLQQAESYLLETLEIDRFTLGKQNPKYALTLNNLASFYQNNDSLRKSMPLLEEALAISENILGKRHPLYTSTLLNLALLYQDLQQYQKAAPLISEVVVLREELLGDKHPDYAYALYGKAVNAYRLEKYEEAIQLFESVTNLYTWQIKEYFPALSEKEKSAFYQRIEPVLNTYRDFVITMNLQQELEEPLKKRLRGSLYNVQLITKAMLLDASSKIRRNIFQSGNTEMIALYEQWQGLKEQLAKYYTLSEQELQEQNIDLTTLETEANELEKRLADQSQLFAQSLQNRDLNWQDIKQRLKDDEAAIEVIRVDNEASDQVFYTALILDSYQDAPRMVILPRGRDMDSKNYNYYKNAIAYKIEDELSYDLYWKPIADVLPASINKVFVAPDGVYNKISLSCLYNTENETFLLDEIDLRMLSSTRDLADIDKNTFLDQAKPYAFLLGYPNYRLTEKNTYLAEARQLRVSSTSQISLVQQVDSSANQEYSFQPLPGTKKEVDFIASMMKDQNWYVEKLTGKQATEENLKQMMMPHVLHVATHAYFLSDLPADKDQKTFGIHMQNVEANPLLRSGLLLAGAASNNRSAADALKLTSEDGVLTAYEAMNLNLNQTELVVLSACETALGEVKNGEGVYGLQRAFLVAGAQSVLMSLWKVNDESTTELIQQFYKNWLSGQDKFTALAHAQQTIREKYEEPYHWAPFVLIGI